ncbi:MAG: hypothetical protein ACOX52_03880 [Verrucomicrobiota bacterium]
MTGGALWLLQDPCSPAASDPIRAGEGSRRERRERRGVLGGGRQPHRNRFQEPPWPAESGSGSESGSIPVLFGTCRSNFIAEWCQHRNNTVAVPGFSCLNPSTSPFDTETDSDPDPDFTLPLTFPDGLYAGRKPHRALSGRPSGSGWGELPQRTQRCIGREKAATSEPFPGTALAC